jgi:hypothetical protein
MVFLAVRIALLDARHLPLARKAVEEVVQPVVESKKQKPIRIAGIKRQTMRRAVPV